MRRAMTTHTTFSVSTGVTACLTRYPFVSFIVLFIRYVPRARRFDTFPFRVTLDTCTVACVPKGDVPVFTGFTCEEIFNSYIACFVCCTGYVAH